MPRLRIEPQKVMGVAMYSLLALTVFGIGCWIAHYNYCNIVLSRIAPEKGRAAWRGRFVPLALMGGASLVLVAAALILALKVYVLNWIFTLFAVITVAYLGNFLAIRSSWHSMAHKYPAELAAFHAAQENRETGGG